MTTTLRRLLPLALLLELSCGGENPMGPSNVGGGGGQAAAPAPQKVAASPSAKPAEAGEFLYDGRDRSMLPPGVERDPKLAPELEQAVLGAISENAKSSRDACAGPQDSYAHVVLSAPSSLTAPKAEEVAYIVESLSCEPSATQPVLARYLLVFAGAKKVAQGGGPGAEAFAGTTVRARPDVDGDGVRELLVMDSQVVEGTVQETGRLVSAKGGEVKVVKEFPGAYVDACKGAAKQARAEVIRVVPGSAAKPPQYLIQAFTATCPASGELKQADFKPVPSPSPPAAPAAAAGATAAPGASPTPPAEPSATPTPAGEAAPSASPAP